MAKITGNVRILPAYKVRYAKMNGENNDIGVPALSDGNNKISPEKSLLAMVKKTGIVCLKYDRAGTATILPYLEKLFKYKDWHKKVMVSTVEIFYKNRTTDQNRLLWGLLQVLSMELYHDNGHTEDLYYEIIDLVAPREEQSRLTGNTLAKRGSQMNTVEFAQVIEWVFNYMMEHGLNMSSPEDIEKYWREWAVWRWSQGVDPLSQTYKDVNEYREKVNYCEACRTFLRYEASTGRYDTSTGKEGNLAHIVSKGSGGADELWNRMHLCSEHHIGVQHQKGWGELVAQYTHLENRVNAARKKAGQLPIDRNVGKVEEDMKPSEPEKIEQKALNNDLSTNEGIKCLYYCESSGDWVISSKDMGSVYTNICEAEQGEVLEAISEQYKLNHIDSVTADRILHEVGVLPFYVQYEKDRVSEAMEGIEIEKQKLSVNIYLWNNIKTNNYWVGPDDNELSADIKMICPANLDAVRLEIARIYEDGGIKAEEADRILLSVFADPIYVKAESAKDSQQDLFKEPETGKDDVPESEPETELDEELDIF